EVFRVGVPVRDGRTEAVLLLVALHGGLDHPQHGELVARKSPLKRLHGHPSGFEDRTKRRTPEPSRRTVDVQRVVAGWHAAIVEDDLAALDPAYMTQPDDILDPAKKLQLRLADHRATEHGRSDIGIDAQNEPLRFEAREEILDRRRLCHGR